MNYAKAIKILHRIESPTTVSLYGGQGSEHLASHLDAMANRKFKFVIAMQRYMKFNAEELENVEFLMKSYKNLQIAFIEEAIDSASKTVRVYSCLVDYSCPLLPSGFRRPKYRIELAGNPILGDGKSDNQNHAVIFVRGEYLQMIDANQDNYLEECFKIRNILGEFEQYSNSHADNQFDPYNSFAPTNAIQLLQSQNQTQNQSEQQIKQKKLQPLLQKPSVAIVGAREYIFSESAGVLGDVAAGKEATFGTLTQRIMAKMGGRLHYGHPDFMNFVFMSTRGGFSKAQKGLHLNEDIYAGMNAFSRGGRIKHTEYFQCGKGRDLGFCSTLNFITKIGTGMGEQMLSREYYWLSCFLPLDRFLTFYYAHPGFHINNMMIMGSIQLFMLTCLYIATFSTYSQLCLPDFDPYSTFYLDNYFKNDMPCFYLAPITKWIQRTTLSILSVLAISFLPLLLQMLAEKGAYLAFKRLFKQFLSLSPLYEVQVTRIYSNAIHSNFVLGGAKYIGTGRGFATSRTSFATLYTQFTQSSIYFGCRNLILLVYITATYFATPMLFFWFIIISLILSPFIFNPHNFLLVDFLIDYRRFLFFLFSGNATTDIPIVDNSINSNSNSKSKNRSRSKSLQRPLSKSSFTPQQQNLKLKLKQKLKQKQQQQQQSSNFSWINYVRLNRCQIVGIKRNRSNSSRKYIRRAKKSNLFLPSIIVPLFLAVLIDIAFMFVHSRWIGSPNTTTDPTTGQLIIPKFYSSLFYIALITLAPIIFNSVVNLLLCLFSLMFSKAINIRPSNYGNVMFSISRILQLLFSVFLVYFVYTVEQYSFSRTVLGISTVIYNHYAIFSILSSLFLTRESLSNNYNVAWYTGNWTSSKLNNTFDHQRNPSASKTLRFRHFPPNPLAAVPCMSGSQNRHAAHHPAVLDGSQEPKLDAAVFALHEPVAHPHCHFVLDYPGFPVCCDCGVFAEFADCVFL
ncbi:1,3-beta-glucan synthase component FKS1 [Zancudomyces culisetae]|uniref:1,3-beta-glucan synthase component FKS1 n=1 Tax=Zancudomyces culisetae TaxID=1213189 RepID=A0A1R1PC35_ZANCU|nr:1,3-beta-glucan synthase component FKS1 [Zancudomyces culisetae]|eukprot:OMH78501.1 1,3-beta-glucan synthase component FKS1 [Zancudomyces culisetae]